MTPSGVELVSGMEETINHDPPVVTVGIGGVTTKLYADLASALAPVTPEQARSMLRRLRGWSLLNGYRGSPQLDIDAATKVIAAWSLGGMALGGMALGARLVELEVNPLIVHAQGATAVNLILRHRAMEPSHHPTEFR